MGGGGINPELCRLQATHWTVFQSSSVQEKQNLHYSGHKHAQHLCVPSTRPATKVQGPRLWAMPAHRTVNNHHYAWSHEAVGRLWEGLCGATLVGGIGPASWRCRQRTRCVQGGGGMRWGGRLILNGSTEDLSALKEACPITGPLVTLLCPGL